MGLPAGGFVPGAGVPQPQEQTHLQVPSRYIVDACLRFLLTAGQLTMLVNDGAAAQVGMQAR